jgi:hypothetical protein
MTQKKITKEKYDEFGCLPIELRANLGEYEIFPTRYFKSNIKRVLKKYLHKDGFMYPPEEETWTYDIFTEKKKKKLPNTKKPATLHKPVSTHLIRRVDGVDLPKDFRSNDGALILRIFDILYETTTQFSEWWWAGRVRIYDKNFTWLTQNEVEKAFKDVFPVWNSWNEDSKKVFLNCAFNFGRSMSYEWDYERFIFLYICIDAVWWIAQENHGVKYLSGKKTGGHGDRINSLLAHFGLHQNPLVVKSIVDVRNNLFHQGVWGGINPLSGKDEKEYQAMRYLHEIVRRCIFRVVGIDSRYIKSNWESYLGWIFWNR